MKTSTTLLELAYLTEKQSEIIKIQSNTIEKLAKELAEKENFIKHALE